MGNIRVLGILFLVFSSSWIIPGPASEKSFIPDYDDLILYELSEDGIELSDSNLPKNNSFNEIEFIPDTPSKGFNVFVEKRFDSTSIKISNLIIPSLNLTKLIFPFHFFT